MNAGEGSPKSVDSALRKKTLFQESSHPGPIGRVGQNLRFAAWAGASNDTAPRRSSELTEERDLRSGCWSF